MKKLISCLLAVLLVCSLMSMSVFAAETTHPNKYDVNTDSYGTNGDSFSVVGSAGATTPGGIDNGADTPNGSSAADVTVNFSGNGNPNSGIINKYAIDITYYDLIVDLADLDAIDESYVWDVNEHKYVPAENVTPSDTPIQQNAFMVTNHSDRAIKYEAAISANNDTGIALTLSMDEENIAAVVSGGSAVTGATVVMTAEPSTGTWEDAVNTLSASGYITNAAIGQITIAFSAGTDASTGLNVTTNP